MKLANRLVFFEGRKLDFIEARGKVQNLLCARNLSFFFRSKLHALDLVGLHVPSALQGFFAVTEFGDLVLHKLDAAL